MLPHSNATLLFEGRHYKNKLVFVRGIAYFNGEDLCGELRAHV